MYVINAHACSNREMYGGIQCISYYVCLLEETKEVILIVAILSFDMKQIKKRKTQRYQNVNIIKQLYLVIHTLI